MAIKYIDADTQESPAILPGKDTQAVHQSAPLGELAESRVAHYKRILNQIVSGTKATVNTRTNGGKWFSQQIDTMSKNGYIPQTPETYVSDPPVPHTIGHNPTSHYLVQNKFAIIDRLSPETRGDVRIAGTGFANKNTITLRNAKTKSLLTIVPSGDINTFQEAIDMIEAKLREHQRNYKASSYEINHHERDYPLIIENLASKDGTHYWDDLLRGLKILDYNENQRENGKDKRQYVKLEDLAATYGIYVTESRAQTLKLAESLIKQTKLTQKEKGSPAGNNTRSNSPDLPIVPDNSVIYIATGTRKKFDILEEIYRRRGINVRIRPIYELTDAYVGPDEDQRTYEGNVAKKINAAVEAWESMDISTRNARLKQIAKECGIKGDVEKHIFFLGEDSGFEFENPSIMLNHRFDDVNDIIPAARNPGVETGPTIFAKHGVSEFFRKAGEVAPEKERGTTMRCILALTPLKPDEYGKREKYMVVSETKGHFITEPRPSGSGLEIDNFIIPDGEKETEAELTARKSEYVVKRWNKALAWEGLAREVGITLDGKGIQDDYSKDFVTGIVTGENHMAKIIADKLEKQAHGNGFGVISMRSKIDKAQDVQDKFLEKTDGVVLAFDPARAHQDFWSNIYTFMSLVVGEQMHDKYKLSKPLKLVNPKQNGKGAFDYMEDLVKDCHQLGTIPQDPATLYQNVDSVEEALDQMKQERQKYRRMEVPTYARAKEANPVDGSPSPKNFNVSIFCSVSSKNSKYIQDINTLTTDLIKSDFGLVSGAGLYSSMGEVTKLAEQMRHSEYSAHHSGTNVRHLMLVEGDARDKVNEFFLARNIYERMEFFMDNSDAFVIAPGGAGTVQEVALLALLKKRAVENANDTYAQEKMAGKDIIIMNTQISYDSKTRGFYDKLIDIIPKEDLQKLGIHIVETPEQAHAKLTELREHKRTEKGMTSHAAVTSHVAKLGSQRESGTGATLH